MFCGQNISLIYKKKFFYKVLAEPKKLIPVLEQFFNSQVFQKYLRKLCYFIHEMLQPPMKELLTTYVDVLIKDAEFLTSKETNPVKKHQKCK